jgi:hypothetical protein
MLLVYLAEPPASARAIPWVRVDARGEAVARGEARGVQWPQDDETVVVLAPSQARLVALDMPPMSRDRLERAVRLALDDAIASNADDTAIAIADPHDGNLLVALASRTTIDSLDRAARRVRIVPEAALAPTLAGWTWCRPAGGMPFVRRDDGSAFTVSEPVAAELPPEIGVALKQARTPQTIHCAFACTANDRAQWAAASGATFVPAPPWRYEQAARAAIARAPDFARRPGREAAAASSSSSRAFRPALILAGLALVVHLAGLAVTRASLAVENARLSRAIVDEAASLPDADATTPERAAAAIARAAAERRHAAGRAAPSDALPLLARAAPVLRTLPAGTLRSAHYATDAWTLEFGTLDRQSLSRVSRALADAGLDVLAAPVSAGTRMRVALASTAR